MENDKPIIIGMRLAAVDNDAATYATITSSDDKSSLTIQYRDALRFRKMLPQQITVTVEEK